MIRRAAPLAFAVAAACASPVGQRAAPIASASVGPGAADCGSARARVPTLVDAGRVESALAELGSIGERCGPLDPTLASQRDALRAELGDPPGDAPAPDTPTPLDTIERARTLADAGLKLDATNDTAGAERAFARARRMLERVTGKRAALEGLNAFVVEQASRAFAVYSASTRDASVQVVARIADGAALAIPTRVIQGTRQVVAGPRPGSFLLLGSESAYYASPEADPVALGSALGAVFSPSGATFVTLDKTGIDVHDGVTGAERDHFAGLAGDFSPIRNAAFLADETVFVASLDQGAGSGAVVMIDLASHELLVNEPGASSKLSRTGRYAALASLQPATLNPVVTAKIWDTKRPRDAPKSADFGQVSGVLASWITFDREETRLALVTSESAVMGQRPLPRVVGAVGATTGKRASPPTAAELRLSPTQDWAAVAPEYVSLAKADLIPTMDSLYYAQTTIARSRDDETIALVEGTYADYLATNVSVLLFDRATKKLLHRVPIESSTPTMVHLDFGPGDWLAFTTSQGSLDPRSTDGIGFIDRRTGAVQPGPVPTYPDDWGPSGDLAWSADLVRDLEQRRDITIAAVDFKASAAWFEHPDLRAVPAGVYCRVGEWLFPFALCRDRLRSSR